MFYRYNICIIDDQVLSLMIHERNNVGTIHNVESKYFLLVPKRLLAIPLLSH